MVRSTEEKQMKASTEGADAASGAPDVREKQIGDALRAVYHEAVDEQIPDDLLDLLRKLD